MSKIQAKHTQVEDQVEDKLELLQRAIEVKSEIKDHITTDFILASLGEKDKEAITEMVNNAYYGVNLIKKIEKIATKWHWEGNSWKLKTIDEKTREILEQQRRNLFNSFMTRIYMTVILNRNTKENPILNMIAGANQEEAMEEIEGLQEKIKEKLKPQQVTIQ